MTQQQTISAATAQDIRERCARLDAWVDSIRGKNGWASYKPEDKPAGVPDVTNEERSALEVFDFINSPPVKYFLYINEAKQQAITWMGDALGVVLFHNQWRDNFGGKRVSITIKAINGRVYKGTYYESAGNYARVRLAK